MVGHNFVVGVSLPVISDECRLIRCWSMVLAAARTAFQ